LSAACDRTPAIDAIDYRLAIRPEGKLEFSFKGPSDERFQVVAPDPLPVGQWVHVAAGFDRGAASLDVAIAGVNPAPRAYLHSSTEDAVYQEREIVCREPRTISVLLPPRSVNALVCRDGRVGAPEAPY
jgi:hypothetical protein